MPVDNGTHVPLMIRWTSRVKPESNSSALVCGTEFGPTILAACGMRPLNGMTGVSFLRQLLGEQDNRRIAVGSKNSAELEVVLSTAVAVGWI